MRTIKELEKEKKNSGSSQPSETVTASRIPYDPNEFRDREKDGTLGAYDFTRAPGYDEEIVRHNLNKVVRPKTAVIRAPILHKSVVIKEKTNYVEMN